METKEVRVRKTKEEKRQDAKIRMQNRLALTAAEQIMKLNNRGFTAYNERCRLCDIACLEFEESFCFGAVQKAIGAGM